MKARILLNLFLGLAVFGLGVYLFTRHEPAAPESFPLSRLTVAEVQRIELAAAQKPPVVIVREGDAFRLVSPFGARADRYRVETVLSLLSARSTLRLPARNLERFGLTAPGLTLTFVTGEGQQVFEFGESQPVTGQIYVATGGWVYLVSPVYAIDVSRGAMGFLASTLLADGETPVAFKLPGLELVREDGRWRRVPESAGLSTDVINRFAEEWRLARALTVDRVRPDDGKPIQLTLADGRTLRLTVARGKTETVFYREDEGLGYHFPPEVGERLLDPGRQADS
jgi:hypothetical protein